MANIYTTAMMTAARPGTGQRISTRRSGLHPARLLPGIGLCVAVTVVATVLQGGETRVVGEPYLEALVLAILIGVAIRTAWKPGALWAPGIAFSAKILLEVAVVMLGASVSAATVLALGPEGGCVCSASHATFSPAVTVNVGAHPHATLLR